MVPGFCVKTNWRTHKKITLHFVSVWIPDFFSVDGFWKIVSEEWKSSGRMEIAQICCRFGVSVCFGGCFHSDLRFELRGLRPEFGHVQL